MARSVGAMAGVWHGRRSDPASIIVSPSETAPTRALAASRFLSQVLQRHPPWSEDPVFQSAREPGSLASAIGAAAARAPDEAMLMRRLRECRRFEMARIAWRALAAAAPLDETLGDLSDLADACCQAAIDAAQARLIARHGMPRDAQGAPVQAVVIGMGKLGGRELNFSSDIDLIFLHTAAGETRAPDGACLAPLANESFFVRLAQDVGRILSAPTQDGMVFRVDTMLRPFGSAGPMSMSFDAAEDYYQAHGREWERYAMIKARPVAGDLQAGADLLRTLRPFVYRRYLDFNAIISLRELKRRIHDDVIARRLVDDIKLGPGGIRELEFIVQSFQLVRGGQDACLRDARLRPVLAYLGSSGLLSPETAQDLDRCYVFLRRLENAIQMYGDEQTHALPPSEAARAALCAAMEVPDWPALLAQLQPIQARVHEEFQRVFAEPRREASDSPLRKAVRGLNASAQAPMVQGLRAVLIEQGFGDAPDAIAQRLEDFARSRMLRNLSEGAAYRFRELLGAVLEACAATDAPAVCAQRVLDVLQAIAGRSTYLTLLHESETARAQLVRLCAASSWITGQLAASPAALDVLLDARTLYNPPGREQMHEELGQRLTQIPLADTEAGMDALRRYRQEITLRIAATDIVGLMPLVKVSDHLTWLAEAVLRRALQRAQSELGEQYGHALREDGERAGLAVLAYGKFGGIELGYGSDLDLVFVHDCDALDSETAGGARSISAGVFFARLVQRLIHWLSTLTPAGRAYEVDTELRPSGNSGLPVVSIKAFERYQREQAWTWEHQALTRTRGVAGPIDLLAQLERLRAQVLALPRDAGKLRREVLEMRAKMRSNLDKSDREHWDLKQGLGGLIDIEFIAQYLVLRDAHRDAGLVEWSDNWRQLDALERAGSANAAVKDTLIRCYRVYRAEAHRRALQDEPTLLPAAQFVEERAAVSSVWKTILESQPATSC